MSHRRPLAAGCVLALAALALTAAPAVARHRTADSPVVPTAWNPPPGMIEALERDLGLSREQVHARLANEARLAPVEEDLRHRLGPHFGGSWFVGTTAQVLVVATTDPADIPQIIAGGARPEVVGTSMTKLVSTKKKIDEVLLGRPKGGTVSYIDVKTNKVVVLSKETSETEVIMKSIDMDGAVVSVLPSGEDPRPFYDLVGGDPYYIGTVHRCSIGFSVTRGAQKGFVSAGHCGKVDETTTGFNRAAQGVFRGSTFPGSDFSWVAVNANWTPKPLVNNGSGGTVRVRGSRVAIEGASVCRAGSTTDWHCGTVLQRDASVAYPQGSIYELTRTNVCAEPGDSGGSFVSQDQAQGVTSGGSGNCTTGGVTYFQPLGEILTTYGLTLVTDGGSPPAAAACKGYPKNVTGRLSAGQGAYQPDNRYYRASVTGLHSGCLDAADGVDFDLYLQKWGALGWLTVALSEGPGPDEKIDYTGTPGYYRYRVYASRGSGPYALGFRAP
ncbi:MULTISPECIES: S1 family peptidase [Streptosporangium]|uniref:Serine protease n=1 Tax=Streptosporangium brasiliense TaxID=47480 RepID=A0ABT9R5Z0_9ACTN|nr:S1 family peptidase [Streptosporangium brasiliense]MDP9864661.1 hypothetical protein [Streptosporangium brasiliense]